MYIQFTLLNYNLKYNIEEDEFYFFRNGIWILRNFSKTKEGYLHTTFNFARNVKTQILKHRLVYFAFNSDFNIFKKSRKNNIIIHIDNNKFNNRIENLKLVSQREVCYRRNSKGFSFNNNAGMWQAQITYNGRQHHIGLFHTKEQAHDAYLEEKNIHHKI